MIGRRELLGIGSVALASCARSDSAWFGSTVPPKTRSLVHTLPGEIGSLDPAKYDGSWESYVIPALFEALTDYHPGQSTPMAALATHYQASTDFTQFRFFLRGHPAPRGVRLPASRSSRDVFTAPKNCARLSPRPLERWKTDHRVRLRLFLAALNESADRGHLRISTETSEKRRRSLG